MELSDTGLHEQPFRTHGKPLALSPYAANLSAHEFLKETYKNRHGLGLLQGPTLSGKSTVAEQFMESLDSDVAKAIVDGDGLNTSSLLEAVLGQFGYTLEFNSMNELLNMLRVFAMQQTVVGSPPILIIENTHLMQAGALRVLCELADFQAKRQSALRMVLMSDRCIKNIISSPAMESIGNRVTGKHLIAPMSSLETRDYLHVKLSAAGAPEPAQILPDTVCADLYAASNGWPGVVDRMAILALAKAESCPVSSKHVERSAKSADAPTPAPGPTSIPSGEEEVADGTPRLYLTRDGKTLGEISLDRARLLIGRSEHNDLRINSEFISRHHAMFVRHGSATLLMDLNSTNGTFVNSRRVSNYVMMHDDIVSLGNHRIKFVHRDADDGVDVDEVGNADTVIMKTLEDMRRMIESESTHTMPLKAIKALNARDSDI